MKTMKKIFAVVVLLMVTVASYAQVTATATATATIVTPIAITKTIDMNFGNVAVIASPGTVVLTPASTRTVTGGVTLPVVAGTVTAASFTVVGTPGYTYAITLPSNDLVIQRTTPPGPETMTVNVFTSDPTPTGTLGIGGTETLNVGATLNVAGSQAAGVYVSPTPFSVTVNYN
jgi:hypothetical protein